MQPNIPKLIFAVLLSIYFLWIAWDPLQGSFLDNVDLPIHETGHLIFRLLGEFMGVAGGSLFQVMFPAVFVGYFIWQKSYYSAAIVLLWVGQSLLNVSVYAADAVKMQLVLTSGFTGAEGSFHDWNYMLTATGLLDSTRTVAGAIRLLGTIVIIGASAGAILLAFAKPEASEGEL